MVGISSLLLTFLLLAPGPRPTPTAYYEKCTEWTTSVNMAKPTCVRSQNVAVAVPETVRVSGIQQDGAMNLSGVIDPGTAEALSYTVGLLPVVILTVIVCAIVMPFLKRGER